MRILFSLLILCSPLLGAPREAEVAKAVERYHARQRIFARPDEFRAEITDVHIAQFVLNQDALGLPDLTYEEVVEMARRLRRDLGYRTGDPPLTERRFAELVASHESKAPALYETVAAELGDRLKRVRRETAVPQVRVTLPRPMFADYSLPPEVRPASRAANAPFVLPLTQVSGEMRRLGDALELIAATEIGREKLKTFLPMLVRGEITIQKMTPELREQDSTAVYAFNARTGRRIIFVEPEYPLGALADNLFHEISHATDVELHEDSRRLAAWEDRLGKHPETRGDWIRAKELARYRREIRAYESGHVFRRQLGEAFPETSSYYAAEVQRGRVPSLGVGHEFVVDRYEITSIIIVPPHACAALHGQATK